MPYPDNFIENFGIDCTIYTLQAGVYDSDYAELDYENIGYTTQTTKFYLVPDEGASVFIYEVGWSDLPNVTVWMKGAVTLTTGDGPEHDIIKITESGHKWENKEFDVMRVYKHPLTGHYQVLLEPRRGTSIFTGYRTKNISLKSSIIAAP